MKRQLSPSKYDREQQYGPWYLDRADVVAFRTSGEAIQVLLRSQLGWIEIENSAQNMAFLLEEVPHD